MMKRFGRNQKRKLRELVSSLNQRLNGIYEPASGRHHKLTDLVEHIHSRDITDSQSSSQHSREADLVIPYSPKLLSIYEKGGWNLQTEFEGIVWYLREIEMEPYRDRFDSGIGGSVFGHGQYIGQDPRMRLKLSALGRSNKRK